MSFANVENNQKEDVQLEASELVDTCSRTCRYSVNSETGERRLLGCSDWDCGELPGIELSFSK